MSQGIICCSPAMGRVIQRLQELARSFCPIVMSPIFWTLF